jgi:hypothetical protein
LNGYSQHALDAIDEFITVGSRIAELPVLAEREYRGAAENLYQIAAKLLVANENLGRWLFTFLHFDFRAADARSEFLALAKDYRTAKTGGDLRKMKFDCGEILSIYDNNVAPRIDDMFPHDSEATSRARLAFETLGTADADMVAFIYDTVIGGIDSFLRDTEIAVDGSDLNSAEARRILFKVESATLSERLERLAGGLSDLMLKYARLAQRPVTLN